MTTTVNNEHKNIKVPNLRFPEFQGEWEEHLLGNISDVTKLAGFEFTKYVTYEDTGSIIAIRGLNCKNGSLDLRDVKYIDNSDFSKLSRSKLYVGDILYTYVGTVGEVAVVDKNDKYYLAPNVSRIRLSKDYNSDFIKQLLGSKKFYNKIVFPLIATSSQPALSMENLRRFKLRVPSIKEQKKIASLFNAIDERIATQNKIIDKLQSLIKGLRVRLIQIESGNIVHLGEIAQIYQPQTISSTELTEDGFLVYGANGIIGKYKEYNHKTEQICITCRGNTCGMVNYTKPMSWITGNAMVINTDEHPNKVCKRYLYHYLSAYNFNSIISGSGQPQIVRTPLEKLEITLPSIFEQEQKVMLLDRIQAKIEISNRVLSLYQGQKQYLLRQMFI